MFYALKNIQYNAYGFSFVGALLTLTSLLVVLEILLPQGKLLNGTMRDIAVLRMRVRENSILTKRVQYFAEGSKQPVESPISNDLLGETIQELSAIASRYDLHISQASYQTIKAAAGRMAPPYFQINFPLRGDYFAIHAFISDAVNIPRCKLVAAALSRQNVTDADLEAKLEFSLYSTGPVAK